MANEKRLIEANALLEKFRFRLPINDHISESIDECVKIARKIIEEAPTVDAVEVVHGRWIPSGITEDLAKCSICGAMNHTLDYVYRLHFNYCPNCGADMR